MQLSLRSFSQTVSAAAAAVQGAATKAVNLQPGSVMRALLEALAGVALWLQWNAVLILSAARLSTSSGADVDSFGADFNFERLPAKASTGQVTFSRFLTTNSALVPVGATVKTIDGTASFTVIADTSNAAYSATDGGYPIAAGAASVDATVQCTVPGTVGNVLAGTIGAMTTAIAGVDDVTNAVAFTNGVAAESDADYKARFGLWLPGLAQSTPVAIRSAALGTQQSITLDVLPNSSAIPANVAPGYSVVAIDDGTGATPSDVISAVQTAVDAAAGLGATIYVRQAPVTGATISLTVTPATSQAAVNDAITAYVNGLPVSAALPYYRLSQVGLDAAPSGTKIENLTLNGGTADIGGTPGTVVRITSLAVN